MIINLKAMADARKAFNGHCSVNECLERAIKMYKHTDSVTLAESFPGLSISVANTEDGKSALVISGFTNPEMVEAFISAVFD